MLKGFENRTFFLPWLPHADDIFWDGIIEIVYGLWNSAEPVDGWVQSYFVPTLKDKLAEIENCQKKIDRVESEKKTLVEYKEKLENIRDTLLFRDGIILQRTVREVLGFLGIDAKDGPHGREDITFVHGQHHFVIEVKGSTKSANEGNITQLNGKKVLYEEEIKTKSKGILIANAWRTLSLEQRGTPDHPIFPDQMMALTRTWDFALVTTQQVFVAYCKKLENQFDLEEFVQQLHSTIGVFQGFDDIQKYKNPS